MILFCVARFDNPSKDVVRNLKTSEFVVFLVAEFGHQILVSRDGKLSEFCRVYALSRPRRKLWHMMAFSKTSCRNQNKATIPRGTHKEGLPC